MQTNELFTQITGQSNWWSLVPGINSKQHAYSIKQRHELGTLSLNMYTKIFTAYGYKKELTWITNTGNHK